MPPDDRELADAVDLRELDEIALAQRQHLAAHRPRVAAPEHERQDEDHVPQARSADAREENREGQRRQGQPGVGDSHDDLVPPPPHVAGQDAEHGADGAGEERAGQRDDQGDARAVHEPAEHVAAEKVGAERSVEPSARRPEGRRVVDVGTVARAEFRHALFARRLHRVELAVRGQDRRQHGHGGEDGQDDERHHRQFAEDAIAASGGADGCDPSLGSDRDRRHGLASPPSARA